MNSGVEVAMRRETRDTSTWTSATKVMAILSLALAFLLASGAAAQAAPPANDDFANAQTLTGLPASATGTNVGATREVGEPNVTGADVGRSVWYSWTAPSTGRVAVSLRGSDYDTYLGVGTGSSVDSVDFIGTNDDEPGSNTFTSKVAFDAVGGQTYKIFVDGYNGLSGSIQLLVTGVGTVNGVISDANGPVSGACAVLLQGQNTTRGNASTNGSGQYSLTDVIPGEYVVQFKDCWGDNNLLPEFYDDKLSYGAAQPITVTAGGTLGPISATLTIGGTITGTVKNDQGPGLGSACVQVFEENGTYVLQTGTNSNGEYEVKGLGTGSYKLFAYGCGNHNVIGEYYDNQPSMTEATLVAVTGGAPTTGINFVLDRAGSVSGTVKDEAGDPLESICATAYGPQHQWLGNAETDADGNYTIFTVRAGNAKIRFDDCGDNDIVSEYWQDKTTLESATDVSVIAGSDTTGISPTLSRGGSISGTVTGSNGDPLAGVCVSALDAGMNHVVGVDTDDNGEYRMRGMTPGSYYLKFEPCSNASEGHLDQYFDGVTQFSQATAVTVTPGTNQSGKNAQLAAGGKITGTVQGPGGEKIEGVCVAAVDSNSDYVENASTDEDGEYELRGLKPGQYRLEFDPCGTNYMREFYNDKATLEAANKLNVTAGGVVANINATLARGGSFSGKVTDNSGNPLGDICVDAFTKSGQRRGSGWTGSDGQYVVGGLTTGTYIAQFHTCGGGNYAWEYWNNASTRETATTISVTGGSNTGSISPTLDPGKTIKGKVTNSAGDPAPDVCVDAFTGDDRFIGGYNTDTDGGYEIEGLRAGEYRIGFEDCGGGDLVREFYKDKPSLHTADTIAVGAGAVTTLDDVALATGGRITGTVSDTQNDPIEDICVSAWDPTGEFLAGGYTNEVGAYELKRLPAGQHRVLFESCSDVNYQFEYYDDKGTLETANPVAVTSGATTSGINAQLGLDTTAPNTVITGGSSGTITINEAFFEFRADPETDLGGFECKLDSGEFESCESPMSYTGIAPGQHTFQVRAYDRWGNVDPTPATVTFVFATGPTGPTTPLPTAECVAARKKLTSAQVGLKKAVKARTGAAKGKKSASKALKKAKKAGKAAKVKKAKRKVKAKGKALKKAALKVNKANSAVRSAKSAVAKACA